MGDTFKTLYDAVVLKLRNNSTGATNRAKAEVNQAVKQICGGTEWSFLLDIDNVVTGSGADSYDISSIIDDASQVVGVKYGTATASATPIRRVDRAMLRKEEGTTPYKYCIVGTDLLTNYDVATGSNLYIDIKSAIDTMSVDTAVCPIPASWSHVIIQTAFANILEVDDDLRAPKALDKAKQFLKDMKRAFSFSSDKEDFIIPGGSLNA